MAASKRIRYVGRGHELKPTNNSAVAQKCSKCGLQLKYTFVEGEGVVTTYFHDNVWQPVMKDVPLPKCIRLNDQVSCNE